MKITLFGSTGPTGRRTLLKLIERNHTVVAVARNPAALDDIQIPQEKSHLLVIRKGDVMDASSLEKIFMVNGSPVDMVLSAVGGKVNTNIFGLVKGLPTSVYSEGTKNVLEAMRNAKLPKTTRLVVMSSNSHDTETPFFYRKIIKPRLMPLYDDMDKMEAYIEEQAKEDDFEYTIVRAVYIHDGRWLGPALGKYLAKPKLEKGDKWWLHYDDTASFLVKELVEAQKWRNTFVVPIEAPEKRET
jgi:nucleoside-diphosphate-sugar epimerase